MSLFRRRQRPPVAAYGAPVAQPMPARVAAPVNGPKGTRGMRMRQYRRNLARILRKQPKFIEAYAHRAAEITARPPRTRTGLLMLVAAVAGCIVGLCAGWAH